MPKELKQGFSNTLLILTMLLALQLVGVNAQEEGSEIDDIFVQVDSETRTIIFEASDLSNNDPILISKMLEIGFSQQEIANIQLYLPSVYNPRGRFDEFTTDALDVFYVNTCGFEQWANIMIQHGASPSGIWTHTFASGFTSSGKTYSCSSICILVAGAHRDNDWPSAFTFVNSSYNHKITSWCSG